jgi:hypothetical protein
MKQSHSYSSALKEAAAAKAALSVISSSSSKSKVSGLCKMSWLHSAQIENLSIDNDKEAL